jgi:hypothetical protein
LPFETAVSALPSGLGGIEEMGPMTHRQDQALRSIGAAGVVLLDRDCGNE